MERNNTSGPQQTVRLVGERVMVRTCGGRDARLVATFMDRNKRFHQPWEPTRGIDFYTVGYQRRLLRRIRKDATIRQYYGFLRTQDDYSGIIASVTLSNIVRGAFRSAFLGYKVDEEFGGQGYMTECLRLVIRHAFTTEHLHRLEANIMPDNDRSVRLVESLGFRYEGTAERYLEIQNVWRDHMHYAILADEFETHRPKLSIVGGDSRL